MVGTFLGAVFVFSFTVFVHELGHFLAARRMGLYVDRFAIGFGPKIFSFRKNGVEYCFNWIPFGGFVSLPQMLPMDMVEGKGEDMPKNLPEATPWQKIVTAFWGPMASFLLALAVACVVMVVGREVSVYFETEVVGYVEPGSPAAKAGLLPGDRIVSINGQEVENWMGGPKSIMQNIILNRTSEVHLEFERNGERMAYDLQAVPNEEPDYEKLPTIGLLSDDFAHDLIVKRVIEKSPAEKAGIRKGDIVLSANGVKLYSGKQFIDLIQEAGKPLELDVLRDGAHVTVLATPEKAKNKEDLKLGIGWDLSKSRMEYPDPFTQAKDSVLTMWNTVSALVSPKSGVSPSHMSGAIGIFDTIMGLLQKDWRGLLVFMVFFNVNLAILNILPIPILDGGHIVFSLAEAIRRRPMDVKVMYAVQTTFFVLIVCFFVYVSFFDVGRLNRKYLKSKGAQSELQDPEFD